MTWYTLHTKLLECVNEKDTEVTALNGSLRWRIVAKPGWCNSTDASNATLGIARCFCYGSRFIVVTYFPEGGRVKSHSFNLNYGYVKNKSAADILFAIVCLIWCFGWFFLILYHYEKYYQYRESSHSIHNTFEFSCWER